MRALSKAIIRILVNCRQISFLVLSLYSYSWWLFQTLASALLKQYAVGVRANKH